MKIDPPGHLLNSFIDLNNLALSRFSQEERRRGNKRKISLDNHSSRVA